MSWPRAVLIIFFGFMLVIMSILEPLDRSTPAETGMLQQSLDSIKMAETFEWKDSLPYRISYGRVNITPEYPMPMAGYAQREAFKHVHDSLYCRLVLIEKGDLDLFLISADLLIFPDKLRDSLMHFSAPDENTRIYLSATHTHNGLGGWADGIGGRLIAGDFHPEWLQKVSSDLKNEMALMRTRTAPGQIEYFETDASEYVTNRLVAGAPVDGLIRGIRFKRDAGDSALIFTYSGHPTLLERRSLDLSNDYPGATIRKLESHGYSFAMFMAGMVGSHRITNVESKGYERLEIIGEILTEKILAAEFEPLNGTSVKGMEFGIPFGDSQVRLMPGLAARDWIFSLLLQPLEGTISAYQIGGLNFVSTPCDFSGELYASINDDFKPAIITSFNGDYVGYITEDDHYDESDYMEVRTMNWVGPYYGDLFCTIIDGSLTKLDSLD